MFTARCRIPACRNIAETSRHQSPCATPTTLPPMQHPLAKSAPWSKIVLAENEPLIASSTTATATLTAISAIVIAFTRREPAPLTYASDGDRYVIIASQGGAPEHPGWYRNLTKDPSVEVQVLDDVFPARARTAEGEERERLWRLANEVWPHYDEYQTRTERQIP